MLESHSFPHALPHTGLTHTANLSTIRIVPTGKVQVGQVWKKDGTDDSFLITKIYSEALATYAVLRKTGAEGEPPIRIKVAKNGPAANLPGYTFAQQSDDF